MIETNAQRGRLQFAEACDRGKVRDENQDHVRHFGTPLGELVIVADGIGGYRGGAVASRMVVDEIEKWFSTVAPGTSPAQAIAGAAAQANHSVMEAAASGDSAHSRMGSTVVLALVTEEGGSTQAWIGHVGDSRAYLCRAGQLTRLTRDHSAVQLLIDQGQLDAADARQHPNASVLLRSIGHDAHSEIEMSLVNLEVGDTLLLCTDGLWGFVEESAIERVLATPGLNVELAAPALLDLALEAGGHDNIGIELIRFAPEPVMEEAVAAELPEEPEERPASGGLRNIGILLLLAAAGALLGWYAELRHWIPPIHLDLPKFLTR